MVAGQPDVGVRTRTEMFDQDRPISHATMLPAFADSGRGGVFDAVTGLDDALARFESCAAIGAVSIQGRNRSPVRGPAVSPARDRCRKLPCRRSGRSRRIETEQLPERIDHPVAVVAAQLLRDRVGHGGVVAAIG